MSNRLPFEYITQQAPRTFASWSVRQRVQFEYFNPNGAYAAKKTSDERITAAVEAGKAKTGALLAYGSFNDYHTNALRDAIGKKLTLSELNAIVSGIYRDIASADRFLATL